MAMRSDNSHENWMCGRPLDLLSSYLLNFLLVLHRKNDIKRLNSRSCTGYRVIVAVTIASAAAADVVVVVISIAIFRHSISVWLPRLAFSQYDLNTHFKLKTLWNWALLTFRQFVVTLTLQFCFIFCIVVRC